MVRKLENDNFPRRDYELYNKDFDIKYRWMWVGMIVADSVWYYGGGKLWS